MPERVLQASSDAPLRVAQVRETQVPPAWPGTFCPNFSDWQPGDIVLVRHRGDALGISIALTQSGSPNACTKAGSAFTHAAIYVGNGMLIDNTPGAGVAERSVWNYCQTRPLRVRRLVDPTAAPTSGQDIAQDARLRLGMAYSRVQAVVSTLYPGTLPVPNALYCSTFVGQVVADATGVQLAADAAHRPLHPGTLAEHPELTDVMLEWRHF